MKYKVRNIVLATSMITALIATAQNSDKENFLIKASADIGIGKALATSYTIPNISKKSSSSDFGVDFGWKFWERNKNSLEANIGIGYGYTNLSANLSSMNFQYSAPADADMDMETYIRHGELGELQQKIRTHRITIPLYVNYLYTTSKIVSLKALLGFRLGYNFTPKVIQTSGNIFNYGVYPQYDNLLIDAPYMNQFGNSPIYKDQVITPSVNRAMFNIMAGIGAEFKIYGPFSADLSFRYEGATIDTFKKKKYDVANFNATTAPVTYTVAEGQKVNPLTDYTSRSKLSRFSCCLSLIYRFKIQKKRVIE